MAEPPSNVTPTSAFKVSTPWKLLAWLVLVGDAIILIRAALLMVSTARGNLDYFFLNGGSLTELIVPLGLVSVVVIPQFVFVLLTSLTAVAAIRGRHFPPGKTWRVALTVATVIVSSAGLLITMFAVFLDAMGMGGVPHWPTWEDLLYILGIAGTLALCIRVATALGSAHSAQSRT